VTDKLYTVGELLAFLEKCDRDLTVRVLNKGILHGVSQVRNLSGRIVLIPSRNG
jgi:hypothetical protein